jgi:acyl-CoA thioester hydrolase
MMQSRAQVTVRYAETDMMGIVYHGNYLPWFEVARTQLLREQGFPYRQLEADGYRIPVLEVAAKFIRPRVYDDTLTIVATMREKPLLRIRLEYEVLPRRGTARHRPDAARLLRPAPAAPRARPRRSSRR